MRGEATTNDFNLTLTVEDTPLAPGETVDWLLNPLLVTQWEVGVPLAGTHSDITSYQVQWQQYESDGSLTVVQSDTLPIDETSNSYKAAEAQKVRVQVTAILTDGRTVERSLEPVYVDYGTTPVYVDIALDNQEKNQRSARYMGWLDNSCNLIGQDHRYAEKTSTLSSLNQTQQFYTSWDEAGLRLNWTGADWRHDGDLFIYLDTKEGGSVVVYNPYPATQDKVAIFQPLDVANNEGLAADYMVWVREATITQTVTITDTDDGTTSTITQTVPVGATLMEWDSEGVQWVESEAEWGYRFEHNSRQTDIYLPFELLNISDPVSQRLGVVALATEEERLKLWATMPHKNNINSEQVVGSLGSTGVDAFILSNHYPWSSLADGSCPSGNLADVEDDIPVEQIYFTGADLHTSITADPSGAAYGLFDHNIIFAHAHFLADLCENLPILNDGTAPLPVLPFPAPEAGELSEVTESLLCGRDEDNPALLSPRHILGQLLSLDYPTVSNGEELTYKLHLVNHGFKAANGVEVVVWTDGPLRLPDGVLVQTDSGERYEYHLQVGALGANEEQVITFDALVDTAFQDKEQANIEHGLIEKGNLQLAGTVTDTHPTTTRLMIRTPNGTLTSDRLEVTDNNWTYNDSSRFTREGTYCLWLEAQDSAGNKTVLAPLAIEAITPKQLYLPLMMTPDFIHTDNKLGAYKQYLPLIAHTTQGSTIVTPSNPLMLRFVEGGVANRRINYLVTGLGLLL